jgi:ribosomal protein S19E (S16A)
MKFYKINETCLQQLSNIGNYISELEVKGKSVSYLYHAGLTLDSVMKQIAEDNKEQDDEQKNLNEVADG